MKLPLIVEPGTGPFKEGLELEILPGVNLWRWENAEGKSWLMRVLSKFRQARLSVGDLTVNLEALGAEGVVHYGEAEMRVRAGKRPKVTGDPPTTEWLPDPISTLATGAHLKGDRPAFKARLKSLCAWVGIEADGDSLTALLGDTPEAARLAPEVERSDDLVELAEAVRKAMHAERRRAEAKLATARRELDTHEGKRSEILGDLDEEEVSEVTPDVASVEADLQAARDALSEIRTRRRERLEEKGRREELRASHGERPKPYEPQPFAEDEGMGETIQERFERIEGELATARSLHRDGDFQKAADTAGEIVDVAEILQSELRSVATAWSRHLEAEEEKRKAAEKAIAKWEEQHKLLSEPLEIPSEDEVQGAEATVQETEARLNVHRIADRLRGLAAERETLRKRLREIELAVETWAEEADAVWDRLADTVNKRLDSNVIRVHGEAVEIHLDGTWRDIADDEWVSEGQRFAACYELLLQHREGERVILIEGSTTVGPERLEALGRESAGKGIALVMETPVDAERGVYAVEHYPREVA